MAAVRLIKVRCATNLAGLWPYALAVALVFAWLGLEPGAAVAQQSGPPSVTPDLSLPGTIDRNRQFSGDPSSGVTLTATTGEGGTLTLEATEAALDCDSRSDTLSVAAGGSFWLRYCAAGTLSLRVEDSADSSNYRVYEITVREGVDAPPLNESGSSFVDRMCWRLPGCPTSLITLAPIIAVLAVIKAGFTHPAAIVGTGGGVFALFLILMAPNAFAFLILGAVAVSSLVLWKAVST